MRAPIAVPIINHGSAPGPWPEVTPCSAGGAVWVSTGHSYVGRWAAGQIVCDRQVSAPEPGTPWRRSYAGVLSAAHVDGRFHTFIHGENKNEIVAGVKSVNTISKTQTCFSGYQSDGAYRDCWADYFAFCSMTSDGVDQGPVLWPRRPYLSAKNQPISHGCRHPSCAIPHGGYLHLFYLDTDIGICVARAPLDQIAAGRFVTWCGAQRGWLPSLPAWPFSKRLYRPGPDAAPILGPGCTSFFFTVVQTGDTFLALENCAPTPTSVGVRVWTSRDLLDWQARPGVLWQAAGVDVASAWDASTVRYPRPVSDGKALGTDGTHVSWVFW